MWLNRQVGQNFRQEYIIEEKLLDVRSEHILEIFKSQNFGQIAMIDERHILIEKFLYVESELLAHIPSCCIKEDYGYKKALLTGGFCLEIAYELLKHNIDVDFLQSDEKVLHSFISFFPHFTQTTQNPKFHPYAKTIELPLEKYDVIIHQGTPNAHEIDGLQRMLTPQGIFIHRLAHPYIQEDKCIALLQNLDGFFEIVMPFFAPFSLFDDRVYVFASKQTHPLADMWLQKVDMLSDLRYYNADIHQAAFSMPTHIAKSLQGIIKN
ncbi:spermidine synthase [uncultured Helicobacter sp.]|uniref:spermine/spermidine synthase domain-containing protein n=1 Tax=uncultured Helicobacter sp. TaxID=175537 RepID=UPI0027DD1F8C|nr:spermidine synthase [uncultured Helicobacter sp.]